MKRDRPTAIRTGMFQHTLCRSVHLDGVGVHSGRRARVTIHPADADSGIVFHRTNLTRGGERFIPARVGNVVSSELETRLADPNAPEEGIGTVEHVLAALSALGVDNALVEVDGPEVPILDGSAAPFAAAIDEAGVVRQRRQRKVLEVLAPVGVQIGDAAAAFAPFADGFFLDVAIDFANPVVGRQRCATMLNWDNFRREFARARTFGFIADAERLWRAGFARASSFENTVVVGDNCVLNPEGLRFPDEFARHKVLDAVGDLALAGIPIRGAFRSVRGGHALNRAALVALLADQAAWRVVDGDMRAEQHVSPAHPLPG